LDQLAGNSPLSSIAALSQLNSAHTPPSDPLAELAKIISEPPPPTMTIKQMIMAALRDHFHNGASPTELRDYMRAVYAKDVDRNSISPQLTRLREQGAVDMLTDGKWKISKMGRMYDHPSSFKD